MKKYKHSITGKTLAKGRHFFDENGRRHTDKWYDWPPELKAQFNVEELPEPVKASGPQPEVDPLLGKVTDIDGAWVVTAFPLKMAKRNMLEEVQRKMLALRDGGLMVTSPAGKEIILKTDLEARGLLALGLMDDSTDSFTIVTEDDEVDVTPQQFNFIRKNIAAFGKAVMNRAGELKRSIRQASSVAELSAIDLELGWPDNGIPEPDPVVGLL